MYLHLSLFQKTVSTQGVSAKNFLNKNFSFKKSQKNYPESEIYYNSVYFRL
jgi:hypothetical protein